jgi:hypothetical protein
VSSPYRPAGFKTYYPPRSVFVAFVLRVVAIAALLPAALLVYLVISDQVTALSFWILLIGTIWILGVGAVLAFLIYQFFLRPRLIVSPYGLEYQHRRLHIRARWDSIDAIGDRKTARNGVIMEGLIIRELHAQIEVPSRPDPYLIEPTSFIPLALFSPNWRSTEMGRDLMRNAPHLFPREL